MTQHLTPATAMPTYMIYPRFLLQMDLSETERLIYIVLLDRARLSQTHPQWIDEHGNVFLRYPIKSLAETVQKSEMTVKNALATLESRDLIVRKRTGFSQANRIYVKLPTDNTLSVSQPENDPSVGQKTVPVTDRKPSPNKNKRVSHMHQEQKSNDAQSVYGSNKNVFLTDDELASLRQDIRESEEYIERLSQYIASTGKRYRNHAATIRNWVTRDRNTSGTRTYEYKEGESL